MKVNVDDQIFFNVLGLALLRVLNGRGPIDSQFAGSRCLAITKEDFKNFQIQMFKTVGTRVKVKKDSKFFDVTSGMGICCGVSRFSGMVWVRFEDGLVHLLRNGEKVRGDSFRDGTCDIEFADAPEDFLVEISLVK